MVTITLHFIDFQPIPTFHQQPSPMEGAVDGFTQMLVPRFMYEFCGKN